MLVAKAWGEKKLWNKFELNKCRQFNNFQFRDGRFAKKLLFLLFFLSLRRRRRRLSDVWEKSQKFAFWFMFCSIFRKNFRSPNTTAACPHPSSSFLKLPFTISLRLSLVRTKKQSPNWINMRIWKWEQWMWKI